MPTLTFYPDADPESSSVDGRVTHAQAERSWAEIIAAAGSEASDTASGSRFAMWWCDPTTDKFKELHRSIFLFDTSALPKNCIIISAVLHVYGYTKLNEGSWANVKLNVYASAPATDTALVAGDFDSLDSTPLSDDLDYEDFDASNGENVFPLNATGRAAISTTGITKLGLREVTYDVGGAVPTWVANKRLILNGYFADSSTAAYRPKLVITYEDIGGSAWIEGQTVAFIGEDGNKYRNLPDRAVYFQVIADDAALTTGDGKQYFTVPPLLNGMNLVDADAAVATYSSSGLPTIQIYRARSSADMLSTKITIDENEFNSYDAATQPVIDTTKDDVVTGDVLRIDVDLAGTGTKGLHVVLTFRLP